MGKRRLINMALLVFGEAFIAVTCLTSGFNLASVSLANANKDEASCVWNHYSKREASLEDKGSNEYWVCCTHHDFSLSKPESGAINEKGVPDASFAASLADTDSRSIPSFSSRIDSFDAKVSSLYDKGALEFSDCWALSECRSEYDSFGEYQGEATKADELAYLENEFASSFEMLLEGDKTSFAKREYSASSFDLTYAKNEAGMSVSKLSSISGNSTFWVYPDASLSLENYSKVYLYIKAGEAVNLEFRAKSDYAFKAKYALAKDVWTLVSIDLDLVDTLSDIGFALWVNDSSPFTLDYSLEFSSIYGEKKNKSSDVKLFDASTDALTNNDYALEYTLSHIEDGNKGPLVKVSDISTSKDWIWLKPTISASVSSFSHIYFDLMIDVDTSLQFKETYDGLGTCYQKLTMSANTWYRVLITVDSTSFPSGNLTNLGFGKWSDSGHTTSSSGNWYMSSIYGVLASDQKGYEEVDGKWVPVFSSSDFSLTAYGMCPLNSSNADTVLEDAKEAGFNKITTLYDGRNGTAETTFVTALKDYCGSLIKTTSKLNTLLSAVDSFCDAVKESNVYNISKANEYGIKTTSLVSILYDLDGFASSNSITISDEVRVKIAERVYSKLDYTKNDGYDGLFIKDEPSVKNDFSLYESLVESYQNAGLGGTPYMNLLPLGDDGSESSYATYLDNYFNKVYPLVKYASFDQYPMRVGGGTSTRHLRNLEDYASRIKNNSIKGTLKTFIHSALADDSSNDIAGITSSGDLLFQMNANLAFGSRDISYFAYSSNSDKDNCLVNYSTGAKTALFDYAKEANAKVLSLSNALSYFDYEGVATYSSSTCSQFDEISNKLDSLSDINLTSYSGNTLVSKFGKGSQNAYFVMNYANPQSSGASSGELSFTLNGNYNYALAYIDGAKSLIPADKISFSLDSGASALLIPLSL